MFDDRFGDLIPEYFTNLSKVNIFLKSKSEYLQHKK